MFVVCAKWTAKEGEAERVWEHCGQIVGPTRQEPGNVMYVPHRDPENPNVFFFYEQYRSKDDFGAHRESEHFKRHGIEGAIPLLAEREVTFYETIDV